ncbi:MAG: hypothetical protein J5950_05415 [Clostridia bacterium]|nr:hypothetical protein [Clostridia bacterium]
MKKILLITALILVIAVSAAACTPKTDHGPDASAVPATDVPATDDPGGQSTYPENRLSLDKTTYEEGESIFITAYGSGKDWVGIAKAGEKEVIRWWYLDPVDGYKNVRSGFRFDANAAEANVNQDVVLTKGDYIVYLVGDDKTLEDNDFIQIVSIKIEEGSGQSGQKREPVCIIEPDHISDQARSPIGPTVTNEVSSAEVMSEDGRTFVRLMPNRSGIGDPYVAIIGIGEGEVIANYLAICYRTNSDLDGEFFLGSGAGWGEPGGHFYTDWVNKTNWCLSVYDLKESGITAIVDDYVNYCRLDFFRGVAGEGEYFDVAYVAFFETAEDAQNYEPDLKANLTKEDMAPVWTDSGFIKHLAFDGIQAHLSGTDQGEIFTPGQAGSWNHVAAVQEKTADTLFVYGWIAAAGKPGQFGYQIDEGSTIYSADFTPEGDMMQHAPEGSDYAPRMGVKIPLQNLSIGEHSVRIYYKDGNEKLALMESFKIVISEAPEKNAAAWNETDFMTHLSFDELDLFAGENKVSAVFEPGQSAGWNHVADISDPAVDRIRFWGWIAGAGTQGTFGYQIDDENAIYDEAWTYPMDMMQHAPAGSTYATRMEIFISLAGLENDEHTVRVFYKDGEGKVALLASFNVVIIEKVNVMGEFGSTGRATFNAMDARRFGQRFDIGEYFLKQIIISDVASYADSVNTWSFSVWAWNKDYDTTVAGTPLFTVSGENHRDNTTFPVDIPAELGITGDIYYELEYLSGNTGFTGWKALENVNPDVETYVAGEQAEGTYIARIIAGVPGTENLNSES